MSHEVLRRVSQNKIRKTKGRMPTHRKALETEKTLYLNRGYQWLEMAFELTQLGGLLVDRYDVGVDALWAPDTVSYCFQV